MLLAGYMILATAGVLFAASKLQHRSQPWADNICYYSHGLCAEAQWLMIAAAFIALAVVARTATGR